MRPAPADPDAGAPVEEPIDVDGDAIMNPAAQEPRNRMPKV